jgi:hypothetical protein
VTQNIALADGDVVPEPFFDAGQEMLSGLVVNFEVFRLNATTIRLLAGTGHAQCSLSILGRYRYVTANVDRVIPAGAAGTYDLWATTADNDPVTKAPPSGNYAFALAVTATGVPPSGVDLWRLMRRVVWDGSAITRIDRIEVEGPGAISSGPSVSVTRQADGSLLLDVIDGTIGAAEIASTLKPSGSAVAGTEALRALGTSASTAAAGNDARLSDSRAPSGAAGGELAGSYPNPTVANRAIVPDRLSVPLLDSLADAVQEGVVSGGAFSRTSGFIFHVNAGVGWIDGDAVNGLTGRYRVTWPATDVAIPGSAVSGNFRIDQVVVTMPSTGHGVGTVSRVAGVNEVNTNTLDTTGAYAALPDASIRIAALAVNIGGYASTDMRDRRPSARGFSAFLTRSSGGNYTTGLTTMVAVDTTNLRMRVECSGAPLRVWGKGIANNSGGDVSLGWIMDGTTLTDGSNLFDRTNGANNRRLTAEHKFIPPAGTHRFDLAWFVSAGTGNLLVATANPVQMTIEEDIRPNANNGLF